MKVHPTHALLASRGGSGNSNISRDVLILVVVVRVVVANICGSRRGTGSSSSSTVVVVVVVVAAQRKRNYTEALAAMLRLTVSGHTLSHNVPSVLSFFVCQNMGFRLGVWSSKVCALPLVSAAAQ